MQRARLVDATTAGMTLFELDVGEQYSNSGGKVFNKLRDMYHHEANSTANQESCMVVPLLLFLVSGQF